MAKKPGPLEAAELAQAQHDALLPLLGDLHGGRGQQAQVGRQVQGPDGGLLEGEAQDHPVDDAQGDQLLPLGDQDQPRAHDDGGHDAEHLRPHRQCRAGGLDEPELDHRAQPHDGDEDDQVESAEAEVAPDGRSQLRSRLLGYVRDDHVHHSSLAAATAGRRSVSSAASSAAPKPNSAAFERHSVTRSRILAARRASGTGGSPSAT